MRGQRCLYIQAPNLFFFARFQDQLLIDAEVRTLERLERPYAKDALLMTYVSHICVQIIAVNDFDGDGFIQRKSVAIGFRFEYEDDCEHMRDEQHITIGPNSESPQTRPSAAQLGLPASPRW